MDAADSAEDLVRRRRAARRWGWLIGAVTLLLYVGGFFVARG